MFVSLAASVKAACITLNITWGIDNVDILTKYILELAFGVCSGNQGHDGCLVQCLTVEEFLHVRTD